MTTYESARAIIPERTRPQHRKGWFAEALGALIGRRPAERSQTPQEAERLRFSQIVNGMLDGVAGERQSKFPRRAEGVYNDPSNPALDRVYKQVILWETPGPNGFVPAATLRFRSGDGAVERRFTLPAGSPLTYTDVPGQMIGDVFQAFATTPEDSPEPREADWAVAEVLYARIEGADFRGPLF